MIYKSKLLNQAINVDNSIPAISPLMVEPENEPVIEINADLRHLTIPEELKDIAVTGDHLCETIYFSCPRYFDGEDLSNHSCIIRYINAGNEYGECDVVDITTENDRIKFGWSIDNKATRYSGIIKFTVQFETISDSIEYQWQTTPAELNILPGLNIESTITDQDDVLFRSLTRRISALEEKVAEFDITIQAIENLINQIDQLQKDVDYLKENVVYTLSDL